MRKRIYTLGAWMGVAVCLAGLAAWAQSVPNLINYQGRLLDSGGQPVSDMSVPMEFSLWDASTVGTGMAQWTEEQVVEVTNGLYSVQLGAVSGLPSAPFNSANRYLQVTVYGETMVPRQRLTAVPYAMNSSLLEGHPSSDFALSGHGHSFGDISDAVTDAQVPDNISISYSSAAGDASQLGGLDPNAYVHVAGDTVTGALQVNGDLSTGQNLISLGDASVFGGNLGLGRAADPQTGIRNDPATAPLFGGGLYGTSYGFRAYWATDPANHYSTLAQQTRGIQTITGTASETGSRFGGQFSAISLDATYGTYGSAASYGTGKAHGVRGIGVSLGSATAYGGYFEGIKSGAGPGYGIYATGSDYAAWFDGAQVHVGDTGTRDYVEGDGDLYVEDELEVDGTAYFSGGLDAPGAIDATDVSFNYAGSAGKGGAASDLGCTDCVSAAEVQFNYAGAASEGGIATNSDQLDGQHGSYYQSATNINAGTLANTYFSAYSDLNAEGYLNNDAAGDLLTQTQGDSRFINTTGDDSMSGSLTVGGDLRVSGNNLGLNIAPNANYGITNNSAGAPQYGLYMYGWSYGFYGLNTIDPATHYTYLASQETGIYARTGTPAEFGTHYGGRLSAASLETVYGLSSSAAAYGSYPAYGVYGIAANYDTGDAYGGYFSAASNGSGVHYGLWAAADDYAGWFQDGRVHIGAAGTENFMTGNGDLYVQNALEVDGVAHFTGGIDAPGSIDAADVSFNYAGSASKGGAASDLACADCVAAAEVQFNYAGSATEGGVATNSDQLDGQHGSYYQNATNINTGSLGAGYYSAYSDLTAESYLNNDAGTDLLTRAQSDGRFSPLTHTHAGADITSGTVGTSYYSAYSDLTAEGYLDNSAATDVITQFQGDGRFLNNDRDDATTGSLTVGGDLQVTGSNLGLGVAANSSYGILNDVSAAPTYGANLYGTSSGLYGRLSSDPTDHYGYLGSASYGAYARAGNSDEVATRYGGVFYGYSQASAYGVYGLGYGYGASTTYGVRGLANGDSTGAVYGGYFTVAGAGSGTKYAGYFGGGRVKVGDAGTQNYVNGDGDLFVEDQLEVGGAINYSAPRTHMYSVPMVGEPMTNRGLHGDPGATFGFNTYDDGTSSGIGCPTDYGQCVHRFPVHLPDNAVVVSYWLWGAAIYGSGHNLVCTLYRGDQYGTGTEMASVSHTTLGNFALSDTTIQNATIDNGNYNYYIHCAETAANDTAVQLGSMRINYTVDGPD